MRFRFLVRRPNAQALRDDRIYDDDDLPPECAILEITVGRERVKVRVISIHWPDRTGTLPAEVTAEEIT